MARRIICTIAALFVLWTIADGTAKEVDNYLDRQEQLSTP